MGAPFLWEPLFGWTCWTCLNPPLPVYEKQHQNGIYCTSWNLVEWVVGATNATDTRYLSRLFRYQVISICSQSSQMHRQTSLQIPVLLTSIDFHSTPWVKNGATLNMAITLSVILNRFAFFTAAKSAKFPTKRISDYLLTVEQRIHNFCTRILHFWFDFRQDIIDTAIDQYRKNLRACISANGGHFEHLLWTNSCIQ